MRGSVRSSTGDPWSTNSPASTLTVPTRDGQFATIMSEGMKITSSENVRTETVIEDEPARMSTTPDTTW